MLNKPIISIDSFRNYASKLTVGSVTERASVQAIMDRISNHLCDNYPNEDLTLSLSILSHTNSPSDNNISYHGIAITDEVYNLNESKSATGYHIHIYKECTAPIRSVVLSLSKDVGHEVFGNLTNTASEFTLTTSGYNTLLDSGLTAPVTELTVAECVKKLNKEFETIPQVTVMLPDGEWYFISGLKKDGSFNFVKIDPKDYERAGIVVPEPLNRIELFWAPESTVVKTFTIGEEWYTLIGAEIYPDGTWRLTHRHSTPDEIPTSVMVDNPTEYPSDEPNVLQVEEQVSSDEVDKPTVETAPIRRKR